MMPEKMAAAEPIPPVVVTMVGTGTGDGGAPMQNQTLVTPDHQPNVIVQIVTPVVALSVRFVNAYLTALVGLVMAGATTNAIPAADFGHLLVKCAGLSLAGPVIALVKDLITILTGLEKKFPIATGSV